MVTNSFENQKYMWPMGRLKHAFKVPGFLVEVGLRAQNAI
jgi:hypothetical protein